MRVVNERAARVREARMMRPRTRACTRMKSSQKIRDRPAPGIGIVCQSSQNLKKKVQQTIFRGRSTPPPQSSSLMMRTPALSWFYNGE